ncbi:MAG: hypothetical protein H0X44_06315 [Acidobacteria bacterium]|nr:hypothetical protein [Acidobacteriota bacterium]
MTLRAIRLAQLAAMALLVSGCSSSDAPQGETAATPAAAEARDACALITAEEASAILKSGVTATPRSMSAERSTCDYAPVGGAGATSFETFTLNAIWTGAEEEIQIARRAASMATGQAGGRQDDVVASVMGLTKVEGLGDEAYFARRTMSYVRKGDMLLEFENAGLDEPARENWEALARVALGRL